MVMAIKVETFLVPMRVNYRTLGPLFVEYDGSDEENEHTRRDKWHTPSREASSKVLDTSRKRALALEKPPQRSNDSSSDPIITNSFDPLTLLIAWWIAWIGKKLDRQETRLVAIEEKLSSHSKQLA